MIAQAKAVEALHDPDQSDVSKINSNANLLI
jgi:hypothetical protein